MVLPGAARAGACARFPQDMQVIDRTKEATVIISSDEPTAPEGRRRAPSEPSGDLWSAMAHRPARAIVAGLLLGVLLAAFGAVIALRGPTTYTSSTTMLIDDPYQLATSGQVTEFTNLDALRYKYAGLVGTDSMANPVASKLHLPVDDVIGAVSASVPTNSLLMTVDATWSTPDEARRISEAAAHEVTAYIVYEDDIYNIPSAERFTFKVVDPATAAVGKGPSKSKAVTLAVGLAVLGFAVGFLLTQLIRYVRRR